MDLNEIKKALYKQKPRAILISEDDIEYKYAAALNDGYRINFTVPISDMGEAKFDDEMEAQLLIRYIVKPL